MQNQHTRSFAASAPCLYQTWECRHHFPTNLNCNLDEYDNWWLWIFFPKCQSKSSYDRLYTREWSSYHHSSAQQSKWSNQCFLTNFTRSDSAAGLARINFHRNYFHVRFFISWNQKISNFYGAFPTAKTSFETFRSERTKWAVKRTSHASA